MNATDPKPYVTRLRAIIEALQAWRDVEGYALAGWHCDQAPNPELAQAARCRLALLADGLPDDFMVHVMEELRGRGRHE